MKESSNVNFNTVRMRIPMEKINPQKHSMELVNY